MPSFERVYMRTLRQIYDAERQLAASLRMIARRAGDPAFGKTLREIEAQSEEQAKRIEAIFAALYLEPRAEASWVTTALLRDAWEACANANEGGAPGCAAALLALKRYEITLYESLLQWSEPCNLTELAGDIRRSIAEELVQASALSDIAYAAEQISEPQIAWAQRNALH